MVNILINSLSQPINIIILVLICFAIVLWLAIFKRSKKIMDNIIERKEPEIERSRPFTPGKSYPQKLRENYEEWSRGYKQCSQLVHWYSTLMTIFPFLGILGTVIALLSVGTDFSNVKPNFLLALTSTFWGLIGAILSKFGEGTFANNFERLKTYFEMFTKDRLELENVKIEGDLKTK